MEKRKTFDLIGVIGASIAMATGQICGQRVNMIFFFATSLIGVFYSKRASLIELNHFRETHKIIKDKNYERPASSLCFLVWWIPYSSLMAIATNTIKNEILLYLSTFFIALVFLLITSTYTIYKMYQEINEKTMYYEFNYYTKIK